MNALHRDLKRLVPLAEERGRALREGDRTRLRFHLMPPVGWMNDPNGLCWYRGNYHVFYQYGPFDPTGGVKHWGHWTSPDLIHWTQQPTAMYPDQPWDVHGVYSGSAHVEDDALYLYYTGNVKFAGDYDYIYEGRGHNVALGITRDGIHIESKQLLMENKDYPADVSCHVRDPKVWKQDGMYYMVLGARTKDDRGELLVYESADKLNWSLCNTITTPEIFGYMWECPDLFCVDGQWILSLSPQGIGQDGYRYQNVYTCGYFPLYGDFRGEYTLGEYIETDVGFDYYAPQTFEAPDGRRIVIGWMGMPDADYTNPTATGWQHCMSAPREVHWNGERLTALPVRELEQLRENGRAAKVSGQIRLSMGEGADLMLSEILGPVRIAVGADAELSWEDGLLTLRLSEAAGYGRTERVLPLDSLTDLRILIDTTSIEVFVNGGEQTMSTRYYPSAADTLDIDGTCRVKQYDLCAMTFDWA